MCSGSFGLCALLLAGLVEAWTLPLLLGASCWIGTGLLLVKGPRAFGQVPWPDFLVH